MPTTDSDSDLLSSLEVARRQQHEDAGHFESYMLGSLAYQLAQTEAGRDAWRAAIATATECVNNAATRRARRHV